MNLAFQKDHRSGSIVRRALSGVARRTRSAGGERSGRNGFGESTSQWRAPLAPVSSGPLDVAVAVASLGRPASVAALLDRLASQTRPPRQVILSVESEVDLPPPGDHPFPVARVFGPRGLPAQRNRALRHVDPEAHVVLFYDDDFVPSRFAIAGVSRFFADHPDVAGADGLVVVDGIIGPGLSPEAAEQIVDRYDADHEPGASRVLEQVTGLYGCNMAYRLSAIDGLEFDEGLPLYGWLEDLDFSGRVQGDLVRTDAFAGVHCGEKRGRESNGARLGYSQIANPLYMAHKGSIPASVAVFNIVRTFAANHLKLVRPEPWVDRRGRVLGNWLAINDVVRGTVEPARITRL